MIERAFICPIFSIA